MFVHMIVSNTKNIKIKNIYGLHASHAHIIVPLESHGPEHMALS